MTPPTRRVGRSPVRDRIPGFDAVLAASRWELLLATGGDRDLAVDTGRGTALTGTNRGCQRPAYPCEPISLMLGLMSMNRLTVAYCALFVLAVSGCGGTASNVAGSNDTYPYKFSFQNDTAKPVQGVGCPHCGTGHALSSGASWETDFAGGVDEVTFQRDGVAVGCVHFVNGALPDKGPGRGVVKVSDNIPCRS